MGGQFVGVELDAVGGRVQYEFDIFWLGGLVKGKCDVSQTSSGDSLIWDSNILQVSENIRSDN